MQSTTSAPGRVYALAPVLPAAASAAIHDRAADPSPWLGSIYLSSHFRQISLSSIAFFWHISHNISRYMVRLHPKNQANIAIYLYASRHTTAVSQVYCNYSRTDTYFSSNCSRQNAPEYTHSVTDHSLCAHTHTFSQSSSRLCAYCTQKHEC